MRRISPAVLAACPTVEAAVPDSVEMAQAPIARAIFQHLKDGKRLTESERTTIKSWLSGESPFLQALAALLVGRLAEDEPELDEQLAKHSRRYADLASGLAKVALAQRANRVRALPERAAAMKTLAADTNPFIALEAVRALAEIDPGKAKEMARQLYKDKDHPLRPYIANFLRSHGEDILPQPIPSSVYKTFVNLTSRF
jgi:hypothetical protein